jgi:hypothetical protein
MVLLPRVNGPVVLDDVDLMGRAALDGVGIADQLDVGLAAVDSRERVLRTFKGGLHQAHP